jgi:uncharacterized surface protein with fasciclin (FAS1) repeats
VQIIMKYQSHRLAPFVALVLAGSGISHAQDRTSSTGSDTNSDDGPVMILPRRGTSTSATTPAENVPRPGSLPAETGAVTGRPQAVKIAPSTAQAPDAPAVPEVPLPSLNLFEIATASESFTTFVTAAKAVGLEGALRGPGPFTVLAPNNAAFASLPQGVLENLLLPENHAVLRGVLSYHIIPQRISSRQLLPGLVLTSQGEAVEFVGGVEGVVTIQEAKVVQADVQATNGVIHAIDRVLLPPSFRIERYMLPPVKELVSPFEGIVVDSVPE